MYAYSFVYNSIIVILRISLALIPFVIIFLFFRMVYQKVLGFTNIVRFAVVYSFTIVFKNVCWCRNSTKNPGKTSFFGQSTDGTCMRAPILGKKCFVDILSGGYWQKILYGKKKLKNQQRPIFTVFCHEKRVIWSFFPSQTTQFSRFLHFLATFSYTKN